jgi:hypothetical protein
MTKKERERHLSHLLRTWRPRGYGCVSTKQFTCIVERGKFSVDGSEFVFGRNRIPLGDIVLVEEHITKRLFRLSRKAHEQNVYVGG